MVRRNHNQVEWGREPVVQDSLELWGVRLQRYHPEEIEIEEGTTTIYLAESCPTPVGDLLARYAVDTSVWMPVRNSKFTGQAFSPYILMWSSPFEDGRHSIRCDFVTTGEAKQPIAAFFHVFKDEQEAKAFTSRLPGIYDRILVTYHAEANE